MITTETFLADALLKSKPLRNREGRFLFSMVDKVEKVEGRTFKVTGLLAPGVNKGIQYATRYVTI